MQIRRRRHHIRGDRAMSLRAEEQKQEAVAAAAALAAERLDAARASAVQRFLKQFYGHAPAVDVLERKPEDLYGAALSLWQFAQARSPGRAKLRVVNPRIEVEGWRAPATVVEIVNDDMPFLVDSVTAALERRGRDGPPRDPSDPAARPRRRRASSTRSTSSDARDGAARIGRCISRSAASPTQAARGARSAARRGAGRRAHRGGGLARHARRVP